MSEADIKRVMDAMWDNSIDGRLAEKYDFDFDIQAAELEASFREWLTTWKAE